MISILGIFNRRIRELEKENKLYKKDNDGWCKLVAKLNQKIDERGNQVNNLKEKITQLQGESIGDEAYVQVLEEKLEKAREYINTPNEVNPIAKDKLKIILGDKATK